MTDRDAVWRLLQEEALLDAATLKSMREESEKTGASPLNLLLTQSTAIQSLTSDAAADATLKPTFGEAETQNSEDVTQDADTTPISGEAPLLPLADWDRFQIKRFLNRGGMGEVYQAHDPRLNRMVAIKLLTSHHAAAMARFVREAKHQAGVHHPHICPIFETGMEQGRAYIAMQYIDGGDLMAVTRDMNLEEKLHLFIQITNGLQEAHRQGLIHRDIKPGNILVEVTESGRPHAYVLDFGLSRNLHEASHTRTGDMMGTPAYMAPEQALGELHLIDRRTDIYSLGCTMYKIISGCLPIQEGSDLEMLNHAIEGDLRPLGSVVPNVPEDVETIVMKCLQTKAGDRYGSAQALGEDLTRYLNGEPIHAKPPSLRQRILLKTRKHKALVGVGTAACLLLAMALLWGWNLRREGQVRETLTRDFTSRVEQIEALSRYMHMAPLHDLSRDRLLIRDHMDRIRQDMIRVGEPAAGPGHFALGSGLMVLNQPQDALEHLERAWDAGFREARVAAALSRVLGTLYQNALVEVERIKRDEPRERRREAIKARYGDPALHYAGLADESGGVAGDGEALMAFYAGEYQRAQDLLTNLEQRPWFYELDKLSGDISLAQANRLAKTDQAAAVEMFDRARETYARALEVGPSDPTLYLAQAQANYAHMLMNAHGGDVLEPYFQNGLEALDKALTVHPQWDEALLQKATFLRRKGIDARRKYSDQAQTWFERSIAVCELITTRDPTHDRANDGMAGALMQLAQVQQQMGADPSPVLERALFCFQRVGESFRDASYYNDLGLAHKIRADYSQSRGESARDDRIKEIEAYNQAVVYDKTAAAPLINKASALLALAPLTPDPIPSLEEGVSALEAALERSAKNIAIHYYMGILLTELAYEESMRGRFDVDKLRRAQQVYREGIQLAPKSSFLHNGLSRCFIEHAVMAWEYGEDPRPDLEAAIQHGRDALEVATNDHFALVNKGIAFACQARFMLDHDEDPGQLLALAQNNLEQALAKAPNSAWILAPLGEVWYLKAVHDHVSGGDPTPNLSRAHEILTGILSDNPQFDDAWLHLGRLHLLRMQRGFSLGLDWEEDGQEALAALARVQKTRFDKHLLVLGHVYYHQALQLQQGDKNPQAALQEGLNVTDLILKRRPLSEALALRFDLLSLQVRTQNPVDGAAAHAAAQELEKVFKQNPLLKARWARDIRP